jgi:hypothetical protein
MSFFLSGREEEEEEEEEEEFSAKKVSQTRSFCVRHRLSRERARVFVRACAHT